MKSQKITNFDRVTCKAMNAEILAALAPIAKKYGLNVAGKGGRFSADNWVTKIEFAVINKDGVAQSKEVAEFNRYCHLFGLNREHFGEVFVVQGRKFAICGLKPRAHKMPVLAKEIATGKTFKFRVGQIPFAKGMGF